jgi:hypothetical protein
MYEGARDFTDAWFAIATITEQWAAAKMELMASRSPTTEALAERRCDAIEDFVQRNLPDDNGSEGTR